MRCLVVGGTGFLGGAITDALQGAGHEVAVLSRGRSARALPEGVETIVADRHGDLGALEGRGFDWVFDTCAYAPDAVTRLLDAVGDRLSRYVLISSISVYGSYETEGMDETAPAPDASEEDLAKAASLGPDERSDAFAYGASYGPLKHACERAAEDVLGARACALRVGLLVGAGDYTDRLTWWVRRLDEAAGARAEVPVPAPMDRAVQMIDVRDVAARQAERHVAEHARRSLPFPLRRLRRLPVARLLLGALVAALVPEDVRMPRDHLVGDAAGHVGEVEGPRLLGHARMIDHLEQQVAQLAAQVVHVAALDGVGDLIGLLDRVGSDRLEGLLDIPGTARLGVAQGGHDAYKSIHLVHGRAPGAHPASTGVPPMPPVNRIAALGPEMTEWRRHLHRHPELRFDCHETAAFVVERLKEFGVDRIEEGIATSGVVAVIEGRGPGPVVGLRADMDALPIEEATGAEHASMVPGKMHACGHDGHTAMLLGAAKYLAETRAFDGTAVLIFQPAEEGGGGAGVMVEEGIMDRFGIEQVYAIHNVPNLPEGAIHTAPGPVMAAVDTFDVTLTGKGGHGAYPHETVDPIVAAVSLVQAIQTIVSRNHDGRQELVVSVTQIHSGTADNIVPGSAFVQGTVRTFDKEVQHMVERRLGEIVQGIAAAHGVTADWSFDRGYPATVNDAASAAFAAEVAREVAGPAGVTDDAGPEMGAEDFAYMLEARPGAYLFVGAGEGAGLHHPAYDFNDEIAPYGASLLARIVERAGERSA